MSDDNALTQKADPLSLVMREIDLLEKRQEFRDQKRRDDANKLLELAQRFETLAARVDGIDAGERRNAENARLAMQSFTDLSAAHTQFSGIVQEHLAVAAKKTDASIETLSARVEELGANDTAQGEQLTRIDRRVAAIAVNDAVQNMKLERIETTLGTLTKWSKNPVWRIGAAAFFAALGTGLAPHIPALLARVFH